VRESIRDSKIDKARACGVSVKLVTIGVIFP
jgi:hypothetical protein